MARTYRIQRNHAVYMAVFSLVWFALVLGMALSNAPEHWTGATFGEAATVVLLALLPAIAYAFKPFEVAVSEDGTLAFRSLLRTRTVRALRITSITIDEMDLEFQFDRGKIATLPTYDLADLLLQLMELNPAIKLSPGLAKVLDET